MEADMELVLQHRFELWSSLRQHKRLVEKARRRVGRWLEKVKNPYVAFSTGKDSTCILHLVREQASNVPAVYFDADCAFPESKEMLQQISNVIIYKTDEPLLETFRRFGGFGSRKLERETMQTTVWGPIKRLIAKYQFDGVAYGLRSEENPSSRGALSQYRGAVFQYKRDSLWACQPIHDWVYADVWAFIVLNSLPYCGVYDKLWDAPEEDQRLSYWAGETKRRWGRWAWLKRNYPELFNQFAAEFPEVRCYV
jgi:3'-phosphoadenosine 5'-phosphosulfate sulfotransferase (PAPS reductase)/FAD synthetase